MNKLTFENCLLIFVISYIILSNVDKVNTVFNNQIQFKRRNSCEPICKVGGQAPCRRRHHLFGADDSVHIRHGIHSGQIRPFVLSAGGAGYHQGAEHPDGGLWQGRFFALYHRGIKRSRSSRSGRIHSRDPACRYGRRLRFCAERLHSLRNSAGRYPRTL